MRKTYDMDRYIDNVTKTPKMERDGNTHRKREEKRDRERQRDRQKGDRTW